MAGARKAASFRTGGKATTRACCSTSSGLVRRRIRCRRKAIAAYCATYQWKKIYDRELLYSGPLFTHQLSHMWIDFRGIRDAFMREHGSDYFENSRQATYVQQEYAIRNPMNFVGYGKHCWGFTACDGPGWIKRVVNGVEREFYDYYRSWRAVRPRRRHGRPVGSGRFAAVCAGDRHPDRAAFRPHGSGNDAVSTGSSRRSIRSYAVKDSPTGWWVTPLSLRHRSGAGRADD